MIGATYVTDADVKEVRGRYLRYEGGNASGTIAGYRRVEEVPGGSRFVAGIEIRTRSAMRLLERPLGMLFARTMERDVQRLRSVLEPGDGSHPGPRP